MTDKYQGPVHVNRDVPDWHETPGYAVTRSWTVHEELTYRALRPPHAHQTGRVVAIVDAAGRWYHEGTLESRYAYVTSAASPTGIVLVAACDVVAQRYPADGAHRFVTRMED